MDMNQILTMLIYGLPCIIVACLLRISIALIEICSGAAAGAIATRYCYPDASSRVDPGFRTKQYRSASRGAISLPPDGKIYLLIFGTFFLAGFFALWHMILLPAVKYGSVKEWVATPCRITCSEVETDSSSDGVAYRVNICYTYKINGRSYQSNNYNFDRTYTGIGKKSYEAIVARYPEGTTATCYANPSNPREAVLKKDFEINGTGIIAFLFLTGIGAGGILWKLLPGSAGDGLKGSEGIPFHHSEE